MDTAEAQTLLRQLMQTNHPSLDWRAGTVLNDVVLSGYAELYSEVFALLDNYRASLSIRTLLADPDSAVGAAADAVAARFNVTPRATGTSASGYITIYCSAPGTFIVPDGATFTCGGKTYHPQAMYTITTRAVGDEIELVEVATDYWAAVIPVTASATGSAYNMEANTAAMWDSDYPFYLSAVTVSGITGGTDAETNSQLVKRLESAMSNASPCNEVGIEKFIQTALPAITSVRCRGFGTPEQVRGKRNPLGVDLPGFVDVYVRSAQLETRTVTVPGTLLNTSLRIVEIQIPRSAFPGAYAVSAVVPVALVGSGALEVTAILRSADVDVDFAIPGITDDDAWLSAYQRMNIQAVDPYSDMTGLAVGDTLQYNVTLRGISGVDYAQQLMAGDRTRNAGLSALVRAAVPCVCWVQAQVRGATSAAALAAARQAIADMISNVPVGTSDIPASDISYLLNLHTGGSVIGQLSLRTQLGVDVARTHTSVEGLYIMPHGVWTADTSAFYCPTSNITINQV